MIDAVALTLDSSGVFPALVAHRGSQRVSLNGRHNPVIEADRWLATVLRDEDPPVIVLIGLGLGFALDALERRGSHAEVLAFEPFPESLAHFHARRDWSEWLDSGRLRIVEGPGFDGTRAWAALDPAEMPPVLVNPPLAAAFPSVVAGCRMALTRARCGSRLDLQKPEVKQSMLHPVVLTTLEHLAANVSGVIVEIGAYVGGATIAMARGVRDSGRPTPMVTIEYGGDYLTHPDLPSSDIFGDLQRNLATRRLDHLVTLYRGMSADQGARDAVSAAVASRGAKIGLLCIDADGQVQRDFDLYLSQCADGCLLVVDDYATTGLHTKAQTTQAAVQQLMADGKARELGVYGYGTWMGIYHP